MGNSKRMESLTVLLPLPVYRAGVLPVPLLPVLSIRVVLLLLLLLLLGGRVSLHGLGTAVLAIGAPGPGVHVEVRVGVDGHQLGLRGLELGAERRVLDPELIHDGAALLPPPVRLVRGREGRIQQLRARL